MHIREGDRNNFLCSRCRTTTPTVEAFEHTESNDPPINDTQTPNMAKPRFELVLAHFHTSASLYPTSHFAQTTWPNSSREEHNVASTNRRTCLPRRVPHTFQRVHRDCYRGLSDW